MSDDPFVHESSYADEPVSIGPGTKIWHFSHVMGGAVIGRDCSIGQNVFIAAGVTVGDRCKIQNNVSLYAGTELADEVFCGPSAVFTNVINPRSAIERKTEYQATRIGRGATIGANATIVCGNDIGEHAFIAAGAVVTGEVAPYALMVGVPARRVGWMSRAGHRIELDENGTGVCPGTGEKYRLDPNGQLIAE